MGSNEGKIYRDQLATLSDLQEMKAELLEDIESLLAGHLAGKRPNTKKWLRSEEVKEMLGISTGKLFQLRKLGVLPYSRIDRVFLYDNHDVEQMLAARRHAVRPVNGRQKRVNEKNKQDEL